MVVRKVGCRQHRIILVRVPRKERRAYREAKEKRGDEEQGQPNGGHGDGSVRSRR